MLPHRLEGSLLPKQPGVLRHRQEGKLLPQGPDLLSQQRQAGLLPSRPGVLWQRQEGRLLPQGPDLLSQQRQEGLLPKGQAGLLWHRQEGNVLPGGPGVLRKRLPALLLPHRHEVLPEPGLLLALAREAAPPEAMPAGRLLQWCYNPLLRLQGIEAALVAAQRSSDLSVQTRGVPAPNQRLKGPLLSPHGVEQRE